jgi:nanoRNase/pAp phosphatase (c-di-AMP/oligoRNAs hydrolase)
MDSSAKTELLEKIKASNTALITVSRDPSIDQLAACIGLSLILSKLKKHATAVFSGEIPSTIEFLKPEETLEKTPDSLRDFIISLDRNKADKLRYKVEDKLVKIFITPYRTSLNEDDLEFSQGDYNIDLVITLGVTNSEDLDQAIASGSNILHDATIVSINNKNTSALGSINWSVPQASSLCELVTELSSSLGEKILDEQIATALLTGIVAETARFSNDKTTSLTMSISSELMAAGANQQLVATQLNEGGSPTGLHQATQTKEDNGELDVSHKGDDQDDLDLSQTTLPAPTEDIDDNSVQPASSVPDDSADDQTAGDVDDKSASDPRTTSPVHQDPVYQPPQVSETPDSTPTNGFTPPPPSWVPPFDDKELESKVDKELADPSSTITSLEETVGSPHVAQATPPPATTEAASVSSLKDQLNKLIPQITPGSAVPPMVDQASINPTIPPPASSSPSSDLPPGEPKAPPYPPPLVPPLQ